MIIGTICFTVPQIVAQKTVEKKQVLFTYGDFYPKDVSGYEILVIESAHFDSEDIEVLKKQNDKVLGYVSLGEVNEAAAHYLELEKFTLGKNEIWNSYILNMENKRTQKALMEIFDYNMQKGLDGMFLDNIDNYTEFGPTPEKKEALLAFLKDLNNTYPDIYLIQNAGISIVKDTNPFIDAIAKESIATDYDFKNKKYQLRDDKIFTRLLNELKEMYKDFEVPIVLIEYADNAELKEQVEERLKRTSWPYFIGKIELQKIPGKN
ncbi:glycosyl hydrolase family 114 [Salegentibacter sp. 24]|uniref:endo alpha-1,4 polygalactosaminidase n=1 Tax=Salegentibacter sp. 24 TaxID=2183986 RepID=UPI0010F08C67|nr:endo alpha-1,4 polygalactosaminidase [Salegentibacter sp. 24]TDN81243.1 glycosyl hydrolase family 114 [Salegentibacter sp. 24]